MTPERFAQLTDAYGAALARWPSAERKSAQALLDSGNRQVLARLQQARWLDSRLDGHQALSADPALARRIVASAPTAPAWPFWSRYGGWLSRVGFVGAGLAGLAAGMLLVSLGMPLAPSTDSEVLPSVFDHVDLGRPYASELEETEQ